MSEDNVSVAPAITQADAIAALKSEVAALRVAIDSIPAQVSANLLFGKNIGGFPDDMGQPKEYQLGQAAQNYFIWPAMMGAGRALQSPENLLFMAVMLDAMSQAGPDPISRVNAAQAALAAVKQQLRG